MSKAQSFFRHAGKTSRTEKSEIIEKLEAKTAREIEITLQAIAPEAVQVPDKIRAVTEETIEIRFRASRELEMKIEKLKGLLAHKYPELPLGELVDKLADLGLKEWNPGKNRLFRKHRVTARTSISAKDRRDVWQKAQGRCENCHSVYALEIDHEVPRALGGTHERENLRLLCRQCNGRQAIEKMGVRGATSWRGY